MSGATRIITDPEGRLHRDVSEYRLTVERAAGADVPPPVTVAQLRFRIGSQPGNDLVLADESVSRYHVEIVADDAGLLIKDLETTNGTLVDGLRVKAAYLPASAELRLGRAVLRFELSGARQPLPASEAEEYQGLVGVSAPMREIFAQLARVAQTDATVLVEGESGTGKELVAAALHRASRRSQAELVVFDCAAVPASLIESELFGHERGAFTGATEARGGCFEAADGGTLFLDELGELPLDLQPKLLRVLESREVRRIGGRASRRVDVRVVAATNRDLAREVNRGAFRSDLFYRLAVVQLRIPPLRERPGDLRALVRRFVNDALAREPRRAADVLGGISEENWRRLEQLPWQGNVRELRNFIERTLALSDGPRTDDIAAVPAGVSPAPGAEPASAQAAGAPGEVDLERPFAEQKVERIARFERDYLLGQLQRHDNNISAAARAAGLDRMNYKRLLRKYR